MAIYTITINERITANKRLIDLLKSMPGITISALKTTGTAGRVATLSAIEELNSGGGTRCKSMDELKRKLMK